MLNLQEVENTIVELENGETTLETCRRLAILYIVRDQHKNTILGDSGACSDEIMQEYKDILPMYKEYCSMKREFQLGRAREDAVVSKLSILCEEIDEFVRTLYFNTNTPAERECIHTVLDKLSGLPEKVF